MGLFTLGIGLAVAVYFLCEGLRGTKKPDTHYEMELFNGSTEQEFIHVDEVHQHLGISKERAREIMEAHSDIPRVHIDGEIYYAKSNLREWLLDVKDKC